MIQTTLNYLAGWAEGDPRPYYSTFQRSDQQPWRNTHGDRKNLPVHNARHLDPAPHLDREGFALATWEGSSIDFAARRTIEETYYGEIEKLVAQVTGCDRVVAFDHNLRSNAEQDPVLGDVSKPVRFVHNDYTLESAPQRVRDIMGAEAQTLIEGRFAIVNAWKPISGPVEESPLAVLNAEGLHQDDMVETDLLYPDRIGRIYSFRWSTRHRWYYYPRQEEGEVLLLKCYDSEPSVACWTAHSAVRDPLSPQEPNPRRSIEVRTLAFWKN